MKIKLVNLDKLFDLLCKPFDGMLMLEQDLVSRCLKKLLVKYFAIFSELMA